ncbi:MAG: dihydrodipicolinate reductase [Candidatus Solibacter usitatus]|nr:dihydrodipicolinate reductase [Candidatus Solibacter usitatus]
MGRMLDRLAPEYGFKTRLVLDVNNNVNGEGFLAENFRDIHAAIEFTMPEAAVSNLEKLAALRVPTVTGTTGWYGQLAYVRTLFEQNRVGLVHSPNFSIGVNIFERIVAEGARWMEQQPGYESWAWEIHHSAKKDAPSGTLLKLVEGMRQAGYSRKVDVGSNRAGSIPGTHEIGFDSAADTITLRHTARSREGFARGALHAAKWITTNNGVHEFSEILFGDARR